MVLTDERNMVDTTSEFFPAARRGEPFEFGVFADLSLEWNNLRNSDTANRTVAGWAAVEPALSGLTTLALIEAAKYSSIDKVDAIFGALVHRATERGPQGELAARILLQLMLPRAAKLAGRFRDVYPDAPERAQLAVSCMWTAIREHPARITHHIPPYIGWQAHALMKAEALAMTQDIPMGTLSGTPERDETCGEDFSRDPHPSEEVARILEWAVTRNVISAADAELLATRYGSEGHETKGSWKSVGAPPDQELSPTAMRQRCSRATRRLAAAVSEYLNEAA
ncbi:hypothetical protein [Actinomadura rayongensis]|uniref:Uncharacterized protein n=1 Tax=Actinomadura rayongensis TaxID=1429076 RepID=A0A6I4WCJ6_9ACTN|nr:hypothetical protein [Actinomadura rayongensis]MXQ65646.1 hypothetical protein [Actinomadura rayongensis]